MEPLQALSTDFTEIQYAGGIRKAYLMAMVDVESLPAAGRRVGAGVGVGVAGAALAIEAILVGGFLALNPTGGVLTKQAVVPVAMKALLLAALAWVVMQAVGSTWLGFGLAVGVTGGVLLAMDREIRGYTGQAARMLPAWVRWRTRGRV